MRLTSRVQTALRVDWCVVGRSTHVVSNLDNMSSGGAFVHTAVPAPLGSRVAMTLITDAGKVPALARVVRSDWSGMAVRFESQDPDDEL